MRSSLRATLSIALVAATVATSLIAPAPATAGGADTWSRFMADRPKLLKKLAPAFVSCFERRDSLIDPLSPIFHGCLDWHSAVHAAYSHHVLFRRTGDDTYVDLIDAQFAPHGISLVPAEEVYERAKAPDLPLTENPYGFGWFLILARERERALDERDLRPMAGFAAEQMVSWFELRASRGDAQRFILNRAHPNYSWSLINLDIWARYAKDKALLKATKDAAKPLLESDLDGLCTVKSDTEQNATGFQPACLMRLAAVWQVKGRSALGWIKARLPKQPPRIAPIADPGSCHAGGLNFTRAFALYRLYEATGDTRYRDNYADLIRFHVGRPELYMGEQYLGNPDYLCYSHWVAQVGVRAISLSYGD